MAEKSVTLQPGESKVVSFEATPQEARSYQVSVNGLTGSFVATEALEPVPCVYCGATFSTEAGLISHMESNHPGMPYLVYAVPRGPAASGGTLTIDYKLYTPAISTGTWGCLFTFYIPNFPVWEPYNGAVVVLRGGTLAGFYESGEMTYLQYMVDHFKFAYIPRGTYQLFSKCRLYSSTGALLRTFWTGRDSGRTVTVV
jgi:hypothetical protein